ncbi:unnamed protein product [Paramecium sonneborni]|uniref:Phosphatidylinositol-4-phosphate 5-kinase n=1 Tax=Paramecium sonneborni TaxID=65129 RepID=A0A8S1QPC0_9CILI|nr:unnamed protein product [Paramecium sonneborni]
MGQAVSSDNPLDFKFEIPIPKYHKDDKKKWQSQDLESIKNLRIYTNLDLNDQEFNYQSINCSDFPENDLTSGQYYYGKLEKQKRQGLGVFVDENKKSGIYMAFGNFIDNKLDGLGLTIYDDNTYYHGNWKNGACDGIGYYNTSFGDFYLGQWEEGKFIKGIYRTSDFEYWGEVKNGCFHGLGRCYYFDGAIVQGEWKNDQLDGFVNHYFPNKDNYIGYYKNSLKHGKGVLYEESEKKIYQGEFFLDQQHGIGKEINIENKEFISALFYNGKPYKLINKQIYAGNGTGNTSWILTEPDQNQQKNEEGLLIRDESNFEEIIQNNQLDFTDIFEKKKTQDSQIDNILKDCKGYQEQYDKLEQRLKDLTVLHELQKWHYEQNQQEFPLHFRQQYKEYLKNKQKQQQ